jgi:ABC-type amino acid transport system permease subunit
VLSAWVYVLRGVPMLVLLFIVFFGLPGIGLDVPPLVAMMLSLGLHLGAYLSEVFPRRAGGGQSERGPRRPGRWASPGSRRCG